MPHERHVHFLLEPVPICTNWLSSTIVSVSPAVDRGGALAQRPPKLLQFRLHLHLAGAKCPHAQIKGDRRHVSEIGSVCPNFR
jgi:hypothetical protein